MSLPLIIQGGMGVAVSDYKLARAVSLEGQLGVVSGTGVSIVLIARLMNGDPGGHVRRALDAFPYPDVADQIYEKYYVEGGKDPMTPYKTAGAFTIKPTKSLNIVTIVANFVEVWLAKEGHDGVVGVNLLEKVQLPNVSSLYGAMLAGVDYVLMGAGIPTQIAGVLDKLANHESASYRVDVVGATGEDDYRVWVHPEELFPGIAEMIGPLKRPNWLPIISSNILAQALLKRSEGSIEGFIIEGPTAGGHNAPPRGTIKFDENGDPIYGKRDAVDLEKMKEIGKPFWLAGGFGHPEQLQSALDSGAAGIQVGTAFAYSNESGMQAHYKQEIINDVLEGKLDVRTNAMASPTGFPFKVVTASGTIAEEDAYDERGRICDMSFLRTLYKRPDGKVGYRCSAEPIKDYVRKGGKEEETEGTVCLCNALGAAAGFPQVRKNGYVELPIVTSGNDLVNLPRIIPAGETSYSAKHVINYLLGNVDPATLTQVPEAVATK